MERDDTKPTRGSLETAEQFKAAIYRGEAKAVVDLIARELDVNAQDAYGMAALHHAAERGARACLRVLFNSGKCDYVAKDYNGRTPAMLADEFSGDRAAADLLAKREARATLAQRQSQPPSPVVP